MKKNTEKTLIQNAQFLLEGENTLLENEISEVKKLILQTAVYAQGTQALNIMRYLHDSSLTQQELYEYRKQILSYLISCCSYQKYIHGLTVADMDGTCLTYGLTYPLDKIIEENWYDTGDGEENHFSYRLPYYQDGVEHRTSHVFAMVYSTDESNRNYKEIRVAELQYDMLNDIFQTSDERITIIIDINQQQQVYASDDAEATELSIPVYISNIGEETEGHFKTKIGEENAICVFNKINGTTWYSVNIINGTEIRAAFYKTSRLVLILLAICFVLLLGMVTFTIMHYTKNIRILTKAVRSIRKDQLKLDINISSNDEIEELYIEFKQMLKRIEELITTVKMREREKKKSELTALQYQINPHFMYNTLNTVKYLAELDGMDNITQITDSFMELMYINMNNHSKITVEEECQYLKNYILVQSYRYIDTINFNIVMDEEIAKAKVPKLLLQPLVENALLHGIADRLSSGWIKVSFRECFGKLSIVIEDNGAGISKEKITHIFESSESASKSHMGVKNVYDRIKLYYGDDGDFEIISQENEDTKQIILIPIEE